MATESLFDKTAFMKAFRDLISLPEDSEAFVKVFRKLGLILQDAPLRTPPLSSLLKATEFFDTTGVSDDVLGKLGPNIMKHKEASDPDVRAALISIYDALFKRTFDTLEDLQRAISDALAPHGAILLTHPDFCSLTFPKWTGGCALFAVHINFRDIEFPQAAIRCSIDKVVPTFDSVHGIILQDKEESYAVTHNFYVTFWLDDVDGKFRFRKFGTGYAKERVTKTPPSIFTEAYKAIRDGVMPDVDWLKSLVKSAADDFQKDNCVWSLGA